MVFSSGNTSISFGYPPLIGRIRIFVKRPVSGSILKMPTEFGPVDLTAQLSADGKTLEVQFQGDWRERPGTIVLHVPPVPGLKKVLVNGKKYAARGEILVKA